jgi:hypothetical protein
MREDPAMQWMHIAIWLMYLSCVPALIVAIRFYATRQWVRWLGRPAMATVIQATRIATLPRIITEVTLDLTPPGEPEYVRIRARMRWSVQLAPPEHLIPGHRLAVRYCYISHAAVVMPNARRR